MKNDGNKYSEEKVIDEFSENLKKLMSENNMNQKEFAKKMEISESTLSGYVKGKKSPNFSFLISLKKQFPGISLDRIIFNERIVAEEPAYDMAFSSTTSEAVECKGTYYLYYLDTNKKTHTKLSSESVHESLDLKFGVLYVSNKKVLNKSPEVNCIAIFGIKKREEAQKLKHEIDSLEHYDQICEHLKEVIPHGLYWGRFNISQMHIFISLSRNIDAKDNAFIILHRALLDKDSYGGIGTINSVSTGRDSDPIVQLIALSKKYAYISDEQIKSQLKFAIPNIYVKGQQETNEILKLAKSIYCQEKSSLEDASAYDQFSEHNKETLLTSYLEYLSTKNVENNQLWFGRVSSSNDADWDQLLKDAAVYHEKKKRGDSHEIKSFDSAANYMLY